MKKMKILALALVAVLMVSVLAGCNTSANAITVTLIMKTSPDAETALFEQEIKINAENPTVELIINEACATYPDLNASWTNLDALEMPEYPDKMNDDGSFDYWACYIDGVEPETGRAKNAAVTDGCTVEYVYTHAVAEVTEAPKK